MAKSVENSSKRRGLKISLITALCVFILAALVFLIPLIASLTGSNGELEGEPKVMVIFGYKLDDGRMAPMLKNWLDSALEYLLPHLDVKVIVSGGNGDDGQASEAQLMRDYLVERGIDEARVAIEDGSATTVENVRNTLAMLKDGDYDLTGGVILTSSEFHLTRIRMLWKRAGGYAPAYTIAASSPSSDRAAMYMREAFALLFDFLSAKF